MIPKIAHFHWDGPPMSWLRIVSISTFAKFNPSWEIRLIRTHPDLQSLNLTYAQKADLTWWIALEKHGGFQVASDIVFSKPVPSDWLDAPLCACTNGEKRVVQFAMLGAEPSHPYMQKTVEEGMRRLGAVNLDCQSFGTMLLETTGEWMGKVKQQSMSALCHYDHNRCELLWVPGHEIELPDEAIGIHWYGGHALSKKYEWTATESSAYPICQYAKAVFP